MTLDGYVGWNSEFTSTKRDFNEFYHATIEQHEGQCEVWTEI